MPWTEVPRTVPPGRMRKPVSNRVSFYAFGKDGDKRNGRLGISQDLLKADRCTVETDGNGMLRVRFDPNGKTKITGADKGFSICYVTLRAGAVKMMPKETSPLDFVVKNGDIYISLNKLEDHGK